MSRPSVFVAMSGGVDSSVTAALLKYGDARLPAGRQDFDVSGIHIKMWSDPDIPCTMREDRYDAMRVAALLDIPFQTWDFTQEYRQAVVEYMIREYAAGRTPNPDVMCNRHIKFGIFLKRALAVGAEYVATGHYVKIGNRGQGLVPSRAEGIADSSRDTLIPNRYTLSAAHDTNKDQSYFLWTLTQEQLQYCLFPIGAYTKQEVRALARRFGLPTAEKSESQGICFIGEIDVRNFLKRYIPERRGRIRTTRGAVVGEHTGIEFFTIGQREGIGIGGGIPYYVAEKDSVTNTLVVGEGPYDEALFRKELIAIDVNWIFGEQPNFPLRCYARIRYRQPLQSCRVYQFNEFNQLGQPKTYELSNSSTPQLKVIFDSPQRAVTAGQSVVFYKENEMLGGGVIG